METKELEFNEVLSKYDRLIHHLIHKLGITDYYGDFYQEGMIALYEAYRKYYGRDTFTKIAYIVVKNRLIDVIRKDRRYRNHDIVNDNIEHNTYDTPFHDSLDPYLLLQIKQVLTKKQYTYVEKRIIKGFTLKEIAEQEQTTIDAVKGWGKEVKKKLRLLLEEDYAS